MKLSVVNLEKSYGKRILFEKFSCDFKDKGLYIICGDSGCGKTTLLNILSLLEGEFKGKYYINGIPADKLSEKEKAQLRAASFSYIFQNFNLFNEDTVLNNVKVVLDSISDLPKELKAKKVEEVLKILEINELKNEYVKNLSGGEKQRVAIARAIIISPNVIFCDEPTGSLDTNNTDNVFTILKKLSLNSLVICVTHDVENAKKYADYIFTIKNKVIKQEKIETKNTEVLEMMNLKANKKEAKLKLGFIFSHIKNKFRSRKFRNIIKSSLLSISLLSCGISVGLSTGIHSSLINSFNSVIDQNTIVLNKKESKNTIYDFYSSSKTDIKKIYDDYRNDIDYYGANYIVDFENFFPDRNEVVLLKSGQTTNVSGFNIRTFNEFIFSHDVSLLDTYPTLKKNLQSDEIIISLNYEQMKKMCLELQIVRSFESLGDYLKVKDTMVALRVANNSWQYSDEQLFKLKAVIMDTKNRVYHTNSFFNEFLFEENMRFPVSNRLNNIEEYPWIFKKVFYLHTRKFQTHFLNNIFYDKKYKNFLFDSDNKTYSPLNCAYDTQVTNKLYVFNVFKDTIDIEIIEHLDDLNFKYKNFYYSTNFGYFNNGTSLFSGFARPVFFSLDLNKIENIIDAHSKVSEENLLNIKVPENVVDGYAFKPSSSNLRLKTIEESLEPNEIIVSKGFADIVGEEIIKGKEIYTSMMTESNYVNGEVKYKFSMLKLKIVGVVESDPNVVIYQNKDFSISFFRDLFKISTFNLIPTSIIFETESKLTKDELEKFNSYFSDYSLSNPIFLIEESIEESTFFLKIILFSFTGVSIISSIILLLIITLINAIEARREIAIFTVLGFNKAQILKIFIVDNLITAFACFIISSFSLGIISYLISDLLLSTLGLSNLNLLSPLSFMVNFLTIIFISVISALSSLIEIKKINLNENLH